MTERQIEIPSPTSEGDFQAQLLFEQNPLPMWVFDRETLAFLAINKAAIAKYGWSREEFLSMTIEQIRPEEDLPFLRACLSDDEANSAPGFTQARRFRHRTKSNGMLAVESGWQAITFRGRPGMLVMIVDVTKHERAEEQSREQASLLDLAADAILVRDLEQRVLFWNQGAERLYGWTRAEALGALYSTLFPREAEQLEGAEARLLEHGVWSGTLEQHRRDGGRVFVNSRWTLVRNAAGEPKSVLVINTDATEAKKFESQFLRAQRLEAIGTLASGIAHDLNNILSPILMSVGILRRRITDPDAEHMLAIIEGSAERGAGIVKQVLTFARGVEGERVLLQPRHLLGELAKIMSQTFPRNIDIQTQLATDLWVLTGDATQLHQVLLNLCVNARDAMMPKGGTLTVGAANVQVDEHFASMNPGAKARAARRIPGGGHRQRNVARNAAEDLRSVFHHKGSRQRNRAWAGDGDRDRAEPRRIFECAERARGGHHFRVFVPASPEGEEAKDRPAVTEISGGKGELVLVVDDEMPIRDALVRTLENNGYRAYTAEDGSDALALYFQRRDEIELVLTDLSMGQMDGITLIRSLRKVNPRVRVIASSGHLHNENLATLKALGVKTFLDKPYTADKLLRAVRTVLDEKVPKA
jgi:PAS domain S-box-containing protein